MSAAFVRGTFVFFSAAALVSGQPGLESSPRNRELLSRIQVRRPDPVNSPQDKELWEGAQRHLEKGRGFDEKIAIVREKQRQLESQGNASLPDLLALVFERKNLESSQAAAYSKVAHLTAELYGLVPLERDKESVMPGFEGRNAPWILTAQPVEERSLFNNRGERIEVRAPYPWELARTFADGSILLQPKAFEQGIGYLASIIYHERIHREQYTTKGWGDKLSDDELELEAHKAQLGKKGLFGLTEEQSREISNMVRYYAKRHGAARRGLPVLDDPGVTPGRFALPAERLEELQRDAEDIRRSVEEDAATRRREFLAKRERDVATARADMDRCGLRPVMLGDSFSVIEPAPSFRGPRYTFRGPGPLETVQAAVLLAAVCGAVGVGAQADEPPMREPCNQALGVLNRRWTDAAFRRAAVMASDDPYGRLCMSRLEERLTLPIDMAGLNAIVASARAEFRRLAPAGGEARGGGSPAQAPRERAPREPRERPERDRDPYLGRCGDAGSLCGGNRPRNPF